MSLFVVLCLSLVTCAPRDYAALHRQAIVCDTHCDTLLRVVDQSVDLGVRSDEGHIDIPRLFEGGIDAQVFAAWVDPKYLPNDAIKRTLDMIDGMYRTVEKYPDRIELATTASDVRRVARQRKIAAVLGVEGGHAIQGDLAVLRVYYELGVRYMTLTWMNTNNWADAAGDTANWKWGGLNEFGEQVVKEMNRLGMIVDVSHVADSTFWDVMRVTSDPVIASHSGVRSLSDHFRNLSDDMIKALAHNGGVLLINFYPGYLDVEYDRAAGKVWRELRPEFTALRERFGEDEQGARAAGMKLWEERMAEAGVKPVTVETVVDHIDYVVKLVGPDYVGLGSDFDGIGSTPEGLEDCSKVPNITRALVERGYSAADIKKILGGNFLRVFEQVTER